MALTYGEISAITQKYYVPKLVDNIFDSNALLQRMKKKGLTGIPVVDQHYHVKGYISLLELMAVCFPSDN